jgi:MFS transporter, FSR family, fosmidomycin resistance protein
MERAKRAFALFYTAAIGLGALAPIMYGALGDKLGVGWATLATAMTALAICPLALALAPRLAHTSGLKRSRI